MASLADQIACFDFETCLESTDNDKDAKAHSAASLADAIDNIELEKTKLTSSSISIAYTSGITKQKINRFFIHSKLVKRIASAHLRDFNVISKNIDEKQNIITVIMNDDVENVLITLSFSYTKLLITDYQHIFNVKCSANDVTDKVRKYFFNFMTCFSENLHF